MSFPTLVYALCFLTSCACAWLLVRAYARTRTRLLLWSAFAFVLLAVNNFFVVLDMVVFPDVYLLPLRLLAAFAAVCVLIYGFIWEVE
ncbi:MAG TPA: DUF5985 family protein [Caulobacterales bacterium]|nr:DUF5985 family protein [Caulobacterales bacterium]